MRRKGESETVHFLVDCTRNSEYVLALINKTFKAVLWLLNDENKIELIFTIKITFKIYRYWNICFLKLINNSG